MSIIATPHAEVRNTAAPDILAQPSVPTSYASLMLDLAAEHGFDTATVMQGCGIDAKLLSNVDARLTTYQSTAMMARVQQLSGLASLGYELGLRTTFTSHGMLGFGVMSSANLLEALDIAMRFFRLRNITFGLNWAMVDDCVEIEVEDYAPHAPMRRTATEWLLVALGRIGYALLAPDIPDPRQGASFTFPWPEPAYHAQYQDRLAPCRFGARAATLRFPMSWLSHKLAATAPSGVSLARNLCERELPLIDHRAGLVQRIRQNLSEGDPAYPPLEAMAGRMHVSASTVKRRLHQEGTSYSQLVSEARKRDAIHLLEHTNLRVEDIAQRLGYQDTANFTRAFRRWTQTTPSTYRSRVLGLRRVGSQDRLATP